MTRPRQPRLAPPPLYLFEFCDQTWVPSGARECLFEIMDWCNSGARSFNRDVADTALRLAEELGTDTIVELGAGRAPVTSFLAEDSRAKEYTLVPCDLFPNESVYRDLETRYEGQVKPIYEPVDITVRHEALADKVLVMAGMMHHVPFSLRSSVLSALSATNARNVIFEPLRRTWISMFFTLFAIFPAIALPAGYFRAPGQLRRVLWCWLIPIVPMMFLWDGLTSCLRQWSAAEYLDVLEAEGCGAYNIVVDESLHALRLVWSGESDPNEGGDA